MNPLGFVEQHPGSNQWIGRQDQHRPATVGLTVKDARRRPSAARRHGKGNPGPASRLDYRHRRGRAGWGGVRSSCPRIAA